MCVWQCALRHTPTHPCHNATLLVNCWPSPLFSNVSNSPKSTSPEVGAPDVPTAAAAGEGGSGEGVEVRRSPVGTSDKSNRQDWSHTQFFSVGILQSRTGVKHAFSASKQIRFAVVILRQYPGTMADSMIHLTLSWYL